MPEMVMIKKTKKLAKTSRNNKGKSSQELIELFPFGVVLSPVGERPLLIMKDKNEDVSMPVWLTPTDAGLVLGEVDTKGNGKSPHDISKKILSTLGCKVSKCVFTEIIGHQLFVQLFFSKDSPEELKDQSFRFSADQVMSFCLNAGARFFSDRSLIEDSKQMQDEFSTGEEPFWDGESVEEVKQSYLV